MVKSCQFTYLLIVGFFFVQENWFNISIFVHIRIELTPFSLPKKAAFFLSTYEIENRLKETWKFTHVHTRAHSGCVCERERGREIQNRSINKQTNTDQSFAIAVVSRWLSNELDIYAWMNGCIPIRTANEKKKSTSFSVYENYLQKIEPINNTERKKSDRKNERAWENEVDSTSKRDKNKS